MLEDTKHEKKGSIWSRIQERTRKKTLFIHKLSRKK